MQEYKFLVAGTMKSNLKPHKDEHGNVMLEDECGNLYFPCLGVVKLDSNNKEHFINEPILNSIGLESIEYNQKTGIYGK
jgi:hypothetical protein